MTLWYQSAQSAISVSIWMLTLPCGLTVASFFATLCQIRSIHRSVGTSVLRSLVSSLVLSLLDYGCATLDGLPRQLLDRLQSEFNAAARLIFASCQHNHVTPLPSPQSSLATRARSNNLPDGSTWLTVPHLLTLLLSYFRSQEPVDNSGYDRRQQRT